MPNWVIKTLIVGVFCTVLGLLGGCVDTQSYQANQVQHVVLVSNATKKASSYQGVMRNPVIVIHGLLGSRLTDRRTGDNVWGNFSIKKISDSNHWHSLAIPMRLNWPLCDLTNNVEHGAILEKSHLYLAGMDIELDNYDGVINMLSRYGYVRSDLPLPEGALYPSLFVFDYDWRRDISENTLHLDEFIRKNRKMLQKRYEELYGVKDYDVKFDIVAHSMGGLLSRYYIQYGPNPLPEDGSLPQPSDEGSQFLEKVLIVGTPNAGYLDTFIELTSGLRLASVAPKYPPAVIGTFASYYFMMPHNEGKHVVWADDATQAVDIYDPEVWIKMKWGLADPAQDNVLQALLPNVSSKDKRREIALDHLRKNLKRAKQFTQAMRVPLQKRDDLVLMLFAGDAFETNRTASVDRKSGKVKVIATESGDGKILSTSARFDLRDQGNDSVFMVTPLPWDSIYYFGATHMGLLDCSDFDTNCSNNLLNVGTRRQYQLHDLALINE